MRKSVWIESLPGGYKVRWWALDPSGKYFKDGQWVADYKEAQRLKATKKVSLLATAQGKVDPTLRPSDLFHSYLQSLQPTHRQSTLDLKNFALKGYINSVPSLDGLSPKTFYKDMLDKKYSISTVSIRLRELRAFCTWLVKNKYMIESPFKEFSIPASAEVGRKLEISEIEKIYSCAAPHFKLYLAFLIYTGARRNEIKLAQWKHINLDKGAWLIPKENNKTKRDKWIALDSKLLEMLAPLATSQSDTLIFPQYNLKRSLDLALKKAGIQGRVRIHDFRHSFSSHWDGDPRKLAENNGWTTLAMLKRYSHFGLEDIRKEAETKGIGSKLNLGS